MTTIDFAFAFDEPTETLQLKSQVSDFIVDEVLGFEPENQGEHIYLKIKKTGENTDYIAKQLARFLNIKANDIGFCGLKDRHGITTQWFSIYAPKMKTEPNWLSFKDEYGLNIEILETTRHTKKLRRGMHKANNFSIKLRGNIKQELLDSRLKKIQRYGVPNYFGEQRFGRNANNLQEVENWVSTGSITKNRHKRGLIISSARSYIFNLIVSERVKNNNWHLYIPGDIACEIDPQYGTAPLWGRGYSKTQDTAAVLEQETLAPINEWLNKLEHCGLSQERRSLVCQASELEWQFEPEHLQLKFTLPPGQYATSVIRELAKTHEADRHRITTNGEGEK